MAVVSGKPAFSASGRCDECGFDSTTLDNAALVDLIAGFRVDARELTDRRPSPGTWSPREYAWHMRDAIAFYEERIGLVLMTERPQLEARGFSAAPTPSDEPVDAGRVVDQLRSLTPAQWSRVGIGSSGGDRDVRNLAARLAHECVHHGLDIDRGVRAARS